MAQTKRKRQTKHRGNAAGVIETRGRTGRKPTAAEKSGKGIGATGKKEPALARQDRPPTWLGAFYRAMVAAVLMLLISLFLIKKANEAIALFPIVLVLYVPISYYTDTWMFNRRMRKKAQSGGKAAAR
jgi:hypothetical protein